LNLVSYPGKPLKGAVTLPGDKSISHRAALFAAIAEDVSHITNFPNCGVSRAMLSALSALGVDWDLNETSLRVHGGGLTGFVPPKEIVDCGNSATTMRLLAGAVAAAGIPAVLDGSDGLRRRPMGRIVKPLKEMGVEVEANQRYAGNANMTAPLRFGGRAPGLKLQPINTRLEVASAQVKTCLLLAAMAADGPTLILEPFVSRDHSERMLRSMGVELHIEIVQRGQWHAVKLNPSPSPSLHALNLSIPGDISSADFLLVAALLTPGSEITVQDVLLNPTRTGLLDALISMGADISIMPGGEINGEPIGEVRVRYSPLQGIQIRGPQVVRMIDEFPAFAIAAAFAEGESTVHDAQELRHKESDRIAILCAGLRGLGVEVTETQDGFRINGGKGIQGGVVDPHGDHRLAMAFSIAGFAAAEPVRVKNAEIISESYPSFISTLRSLGGELTTEGWHDQG
jgi:3-phosphoshikimate 1-carboxyvinyltransferase